MIERADTPPRKRRRYVRSREANAYHEAGHAVVAHVLGIQVHYVRLDSEGKRAECRADTGFECPAPDALLVRLAGSVADRIADLTDHILDRQVVEIHIDRVADTDWSDPQSVEMYDKLASALGSDIATSALSAYSAAGNDVETAKVMVRDAEASAEVLLREQWPFVEKLALRLLEVGFVSGTEVRALGEVV